MYIFVLLYVFVSIIFWCVCLWVVVDGTGGGEQGDCGKNAQVGVLGQHDHEESL